MVQHGINSAYMCTVFPQSMSPFLVSFYK